MTQYFKQFSLEIAFILTLTFSLLLFAFLFGAVRTGDGGFYYGMLLGLAQNGSPSISDQISELVRLRVGFNLPEGGLIQSLNGSTYGVHFWGYSFFALPIYFVINSLSGDTLLSFEILNILSLSLAMFYVLTITKWPTFLKWTVTILFLFSTGLFYLQWTSPELFTASMLLISASAFVKKQYIISAIGSSIASIQNPSAAVLAVFALIFFTGTFYVRLRNRSMLRKDIYLPLLGGFSSMLIISVPYIWAWKQFRVLNPIASKGYLDTDLPSWFRINSFFFDLNQGLFIGVPALAILLFSGVIFRLIQVAKRSKRILVFADLLLLASSIMMIGPLTHVGWNTDASGIMRYASWAMIPLLIWAVVENYDYLSENFQTLSIVVITAQVISFSALGGIFYESNSSYIKHRDFVNKVWEINPDVYNPDPSVFSTRTVGQEFYYADIPTPVAYIDKSGGIRKILVREADLTSGKLDSIYCNASQHLIEINRGNGINDSELTPTDYGYFYINGNYTCR